MTDAGAGAGARLLSSLRAAGCPSLGRLRGEDLDWMFEGDPEVAEWLRRLCAEVGAAAQDAREVTLDREEVEEWEALRGAERVLEGRALEEALQVGCQASLCESIRTIARSNFPGHVFVEALLQEG